jgi:hypothetical protein
MTPGMLGPLILLAVSVSAAPSAGPPVTERLASDRPRVSATANATVSIRIISGVRFGSSQLSGAAGAARRTSVLADSDGLARPAELLEFQ